MGTGLDVSGASDRTGEHWSVDVEPELTSIGPTRLAVREHLVGCGVSDVAGAELMVSELVGNAIIHAGGEITVTVRVDDGRVRVEVHDGSRVLPEPQKDDPLRPGGYGLRIVQTLAFSWGVIPVAADGKTVWFELPVTLSRA
jgi:hypothetical protein